MDTFRLEAINLGELVKLRIGHDNRGVGPGWFLEKVTVEVVEKYSNFHVTVGWLRTKTIDRLLEN